MKFSLSNKFLLLTNLGETIIATSFATENLYYILFILLTYEAWLFIHIYIFTQVYILLQYLYIICSFFK